MTKSDSPSTAELLSSAATEQLRAKPLRDLPPIGPALTLVPARMVNEVLYCERLMYLEWVQNEWESNAFTADGTRVHKRVDASKKKLKPPTTAQSQNGEPLDAPGDPPYQARSVTLTSERLGLIAKLDVVDVEGGRTLAVEYKRGKKPNIPEGAYLPERAQLCCHVLLLRDNGYPCDGGEIYFAGDHQRTPIVIDDALIEITLNAIKRVRELSTQGQIPPPLVNSPKCPYCSLNAICLPDETNYLRAKHLPLFVAEPDLTNSSSNLAPINPPLNAEELDESTNALSSSEADLTSSEPPRTDTASPLPRPLFTRRDEKLPMYVTKQGAVVRLDGHQLLVYAEGEKLHEARLPSTSHLSLFGNVQISTQAIRSLLERGIGLHFFTYGGWWSGACVGADSNNVELRIAQYRAGDNPELSLQLARVWIHSKISNCRTLLRRNHKSPSLPVLNELKILGRKALEAPSPDTLLGLEGTAARTYFSEFTGMLSETSVSDGFSWETRNRRPPKDRLNALLSFAYSLLTKDVTAACRTAGLDPLLGFYHRPQFGRPSLALDLMEEFRPLIADSTVINVVNNNILDADDFHLNGTGVALADKARRKFIQAYEKRLAQEVLHPVFGYRVSYRRVLELQARLLTRLLLGEIDQLPPFKTR